MQHGLGSHIDTIPESDFPFYLQVTIPQLPFAGATTQLCQIVWLSSVFYNACLGFIKTSVLALYMRLGNPTLRRRAMFMAVVVGCQATANVMTCLFQCSPVKKAWDLTVITGHCVNIDAFYLANAALNILTDFLTYILPIDLVRHLQIPTKQKFGLGVMLGLGLLYVTPTSCPGSKLTNRNSACLSSIIRITFLPRLLSSSDATYAISPAMYWSVIETNIGILAASIPSFKSLFKRYLPRLIGDYSSKNHTLATDAKFPPHNSETSRSGFVELGGGSSHVEEVAMETFYASPTGIDTNIASGKAGGGGYNGSACSSEEMIIPPQGMILAQTQISRHVSVPLREDVPNVGGKRAHVP